MIVAGFGFRSGVALSTLRATLAEAQRGLSPVTHLATALDKVPELAPLAEALGLPLIGILPEALAAMPTLTQSAASKAARATGSVAEASALAAAGTGARLLAPRQISANRVATCAIAEGYST